MAFSYPTGPLLWREEASEADLLHEGNEPRLRSAYPTLSSEKMPSMLF